MQKLNTTSTVVSFSKNKYIDLAGSNKTGLRLRQLVEDRWIEWVDQVARAPWLRNWKNSQLLGCTGCTPCGHLVTTSMVEEFERAHKVMLYNGPHRLIDCSSVALVIFSSAVWGFGVEGWLRSLDTAGEVDAVEVAKAKIKIVKGGFGRTQGAPRARGSKLRIHDAMSKVLELQCVKRPNAARTYFWDSTMYQGLYISLPCEYCDLDKWLEQLYQEIL